MTRGARYNLVHALALIVAGWCLFMIVAGAMVTSMQAGDSVPDWPLSYGSLMPRMVGNVFWEHGHRLVGMALGLLVIGFTVLVLRTDRRSWVRRVAVIGLVGVCLQGLLGGLRVKLVSSPTIQHIFFADPTGAQVAELRAGVAIVHTALAQSILGIFAILVAATSRSWRRVRPEGTPAGCTVCGYDLRGHAADAARCPECGQAAELAVAPFATANAQRVRVLATITVGMIFLQILLGALRRQTHTTIIPHAVGAALVVLHVILLVRRILADVPLVTSLVPPALALLLCAAAQIGLGVTSWVLTASPRVPAVELPQIAGSTELAGFVLSSHLAVGALTLALAVIIAARSRHDLATTRGAVQPAADPAGRVVTA